MAIPAGKAAAMTKLYFFQKSGYFLLRYCQENQTTGTFPKKLPKLYGDPQRAGPAVIMTGWICRSISDLGHFFLSAQWTIGMATPIGNPSNIMLYRRPGPNSLLGERVPKNTAEEKKVLCLMVSEGSYIRRVTYPGQVNPKAALDVQTSLNDIWKFKIPALIKVKMRVATT